MDFKEYYDQLKPFAEEGSYSTENLSIPGFSDYILKFRTKFNEVADAQRGFSPSAWASFLKKEQMHNKKGMFDALQEENSEAKRNLLDQLQFYGTDDLLNKYKDYYSKEALRGMLEGDYGINIPFGAERTKMLTPYMRAFNYWGGVGDHRLDDNIYVAGHVPEKTLVHEGRHGSMDFIDGEEEYKNRALDYLYTKGKDPVEANKTLDWVKSSKGLSSVEDAKQYLIQLLKDYDLNRTRLK